MRSLAIFIIFSLATQLAAARILLKDGSYVRGRVTKVNTTSIFVDQEGEGQQEIKRSDIDVVVYERGTSDADNVRSEPEMPGLAFIDGLIIGNFIVYGQAGWHDLDLDPLNDALKRNGYSSLKEDQLAVGGGAHFTINNVVLGGDGAFLWSEGRDDIIAGNNLKTSFSAFRAVGIIGYLVYASKHVDLFPFVGLGLAGMNITITNSQEDSFDNIVSTGQRGAVISSGSGLLTAGGEVLLKIPVLSFKNSDVGMVLGARGGYDLAFAQSDWVMGGINDRVPVNSGPEARISGFYATVVFGAWMNFDWRL